MPVMLNIDYIKRAVVPSTFNYLSVTPDKYPQLFAIGKLINNFYSIIFIQSDMPNKDSNSYIFNSIQCVK